MTTLKSLFLKNGINSETYFDIYDICKDLNKSNDLKLECYTVPCKSLEPPCIK